MGADVRAFPTGGNVCGGISSTDSNYTEKKCRSLTNKEPQATQAVSSTSSEGNHAACRSFMRG